MTTPTTLTGTGKLVRLILRRDRFLLPLWILVLALLPIQTAAALDQFYSTPAALRELYGTVVGTPGLLAMLGPAFGATLGALTTWRAGLVFTIVAWRACSPSSGTPAPTRRRDGASCWAPPSWAGTRR